MSVRYLDLADYVIIAEAVTGLGVETVAKVLNLDLDDAALHSRRWLGSGGMSCIQTSPTRQRSW